MSTVVMPRLSDSMEEGTILKWLKSAGDQVKRGDELVEIETDKANMTYEADRDGVLEIIASEGDTLPVGETIAEIGVPGEKKASKAPEKKVAAEAKSEPAQAASLGDASSTTQAKPQGQSSPQPVAPAKSNGRPEEDGTAVAGQLGQRIKASPLARRMASEAGLQLENVQGTGPGGRMVKVDVQAATTVAAPGVEGFLGSAATQTQVGAAALEGAGQSAAQPATEGRAAAQVPPAPIQDVSAGATIKGDVAIEDLTRLQQTVARRMAESKATAPEFVLNIEVDMEEAVKLRKQLKALSAGGITPSFNDFVVKSAALALREFPRANGAYRDGKFELYSRVSVGIAVAGQDALMVPTVFDADRKSLVEIAKDARAVAERVRAGAITPPELSGGTFTVSNLGMFGIKNFTAVINPPQAAILAVGAMTERPVVRDGEVVVRNIMELTLSCDHRILYGADAAQFLTRIRERLEEPLLLAL